MVYDGLGENKVLENYVCPQVFLNPKSFFIPQTFFLILYVFPMHSIGLRREWVGDYNSVWGLRFFLNPKSFFIPQTFFVFIYVSYAFNRLATRMGWGL